LQVAGIEAVVALDLAFRYPAGGAGRRARVIRLRVSAGRSAQGAWPASLSTVRLARGRAASRESVAVQGRGSSPPKIIVTGQVTRAAAWRRSWVPRAHARDVRDGGYQVRVTRGAAESQLGAPRVTRDRPPVEAEGLPEKVRAVLERQQAARH
jgi:hypothetical protein